MASLPEAAQSRCMKSRWSQAGRSSPRNMKPRFYRIVIFIHFSLLYQGFWATALIVNWTCQESLKQVPVFIDVKTFGNICMKLIIIFDSQGWRGRGSKEDSGIVLKSKAPMLPSIVISHDHFCNSWSFVSYCHHAIDSFVIQRIVYMLWFQKYNFGIRIHSWY